MQTDSLSVFALLVCHVIATVQATDRSALCFLTRQPPAELFDFFRTLVNDGRGDQLDFFAMMDDNEVDPKSLNISSHLRLLQVPNKQCIEHEYQLTTSLGPEWDNITAWDKALLYFGLLNRNYSFVWFIEDDVFIPSTRAFLSLHRLYANKADLVVPRNEINRNGDISQWLWRMEVEKFVLPWSSSMVNIVGFSRRMFAEIDEYIRWRGSVPFHEFFFNTLAIQLNLTIIAPTELTTILYRYEYPWDLVEKLPNNIYHPLKDLALQNAWRAKLNNATSNLSSEIDFDYLNNLCHNNRSMSSRKRYLSDFLARFDRIKSTLSPSTRLSLRANFSALHLRCEQHNVSEAILGLIQRLTDHAQKLPEDPMDELVLVKSALHRKLEEILIKNKAEVLRLVAKNRSDTKEINRLRVQAANVTAELLTEIKREMKAEEEEKNNTRGTTRWTTTTEPSTALSSSESTTIYVSTQTTVKSSTTTKKRNSVSFIFSRRLQDAQGIFVEEEVKMIVLLFSVSFLILVALWWKKIQRQTLVVMLMFYLLFVFCFYII